MIVFCSDDTPSGGGRVSVVGFDFWICLCDIWSKHDYNQCSIYNTPSCCGCCFCEKGTFPT